MSQLTLSRSIEFLPPKITAITTSPFISDLSFMELAGKFSHLPGTIVLMSGGDSDCARYNILGVDPWLTLRTTLTNATVDFGGRTRTFAADPLLLLQEIVRRYHLSVGDYPFPLCAGLLGYLSYDLKDCVEVLPRTSVDDLGLPHIFMVAPSVIVVEDRLKRQRSLSVTAFEDDASDATIRKAAFERAVSAPEIERTQGGRHQGTGMTSCFTRDEYMRAIETIRDYILRGHVYQVNMSQRFETAYGGDPFELFASLFNRNPAAFFAYINAHDHHVVSTSPERFVEVRGKSVETRPIKGTRPRGKTPEEDLRLRGDLEHSRKDDAELSMIVDLLRNDIGKVCRAGSVKVREHKRIEAYENVFHLVSIIDGVLDDDKDAVDLIRATFPGGSITGCPKIRSMEIIDELEPVRRHIYTGSIGYIGFHDTMDLSIAIRTATIAGGRLVFSVGGGIVYDSNPSDEYEETLHKGRTLMNVIGRASVKTASTSVMGWCDGKFMPLEAITVPVTDEGFVYGYGIFETIRVQKGKLCRLNAHLDRFNRSWRTCFGTESPDVTWDSVIAQVVDRSGLSEDVAAVKILGAAGNPAKSGSRKLVVTARRYQHRLTSIGRDGLNCAVYPYPLHSHLSSHKTMNYMFCKMASEWAKRNGADEALIMNVDGSVRETTTANILCIIDGAWFRPQSEHVLAGTMEKAVCDLLAQRGTTVAARKIFVDDLKKADGVFLTNALMGIVPMLRIDDTAISRDRAEVCRDINSIVFG